MERNQTSAQKSADNERSERWKAKKNGNRPKKSHNNKQHRVTSSGLSVKSVRLFFNGTSHQLYVSNGYQTRDGISDCIKSLYHFSEQDKVIGLMPIHEETGMDDGALVPLELIAISNEILDNDRWYRPQLLGSSNIERGMAPNNADNVASSTQDNTTGYFPDPWQDYEYFHSYSKLTIHGEMLKDESRTKAYREAFLTHGIDFKDKVVMDLGCGTGILSFFSIEAGAKKVYAIEASDIAEWAETLIAANNMGGRIEVIKGKIENISLPEKVDIIVSEWMGTLLIFESMMESLLYARDHFLKPEGMMMPSHANIYLCPVTMEEYWNDKTKFWDQKPYGVDMSVFIPFAKKCAFEKPIIDQYIKEEFVLAPSLLIKHFDISKETNPYEKTTVQFTFKVSKDGTLHGFCGWFDVRFLGSNEKEVLLSTAPGEKDTHWHQLLLLVDSPVQVKKDQIIKGTFRYQRNPDLLRHLIIDVMFAVEGMAEGQSKRFFLWGIE